MQTDKYIYLNDQEDNKTIVEVQKYGPDELTKSDTRANRGHTKV